jgi:hypothetical protein
MYTAVVAIMVGWFLQSATTCADFETIKIGLEINKNLHPNGIWEWNHDAYRYQVGDQIVPEYSNIDSSTFLGRC